MGNRGLSQIPIVAMNAGELSPKLDARVDLQKYASGCRQLQNATVFTYGGFTRRPGTQYIAGAKHNDKKCRLLDFQFSTTTTFVLELGHQYIRFYTDGGQIMKGGTEYERSTPWKEDELFDIQYSQINDVMYMVHPNHPVQKLSREADDDWTLEEVVFDLPPLLDENLTTITITPSAKTGTGITLTASSSLFANGHIGSYWQIAHVRDAVSEQIALTANASSASVKVLGDWSMRTYGKWEADVLIQRSVDDGSTWETIRKYTGQEDRNVDVSGTEDDEVLLRIKIENYVAHSGTPDPRSVLEAVDALIYGLVKITAVASGTSATADVVDDIHSTVATTIWSEGSWSDVRGYPRAVTIYEQRMVFAGTSHKPQTIWASVTGDYENFRRGSDDDQGFSYTLGATKRNAIQWLVNQKALLIGTSGGEWSMSAGGQGTEEPLTPTNVFVRQHDTKGSNSVQALMVNDVVLFIQRAGKKVREFAYTFESDGYKAPDMTKLAEHITEGGIVNIAYQQQNDPILWAITGEGKLIGMTYEREENVIAWHRHVTEGEFESVAIVYGSGADEVWVSVKREIDGSTKRYIERVNPTEWEDKEDAFYVDSGLSYDGAAATVFSGLGHLEGKEVAILADGAPEPRQTVSSGQITLDTEASVVHVGLPYETIFEPMRLDTDPQAGITIAREKRVRSVTIRFLDSLGLKWSDGDGTFYDLSFRDTADEMNDSPPLFTGDKDVPWYGNSDMDPRVILKQDQPLPMTVLAVIPKYQITGQ